MKRLLTIAGSDSSGGAGIQADLKAFAVLGTFGMSAVTALTAQNTLGVQSIHAVPPDFIGEQIDSVFSDIGVDAVKTGMLANSAIIEVVAERLRRYKPPRIVVDPVMRAKGGNRLLEPEAEAALTERLLPLAEIVTPNLHEAAALAGEPVADLAGMRRAAERIGALGPRWVLIKGGHLAGDATDLLYDGETFTQFTAERIATPNTHGTGCTTASAIAALLAQGFDVPEAVRRAKGFITEAIRHALPLGGGHGPTNPLAWLKAGTASSQA